jgi:hypothetical protein
MLNNKTKIKKKIPCNKCTFKAILVEKYKGLVGQYVQQRGLYRCFSGHEQIRILKIYSDSDTLKEKKEMDQKVKDSDIKGI